MSSKSIEYHCERFRQLQVDRSPREQKWRAISEYMRPVRAEFRGVYDSGQLPAEVPPYVTSGVAAIAVDNFVGGIYGFLSNEANSWLTFETYDEDLNQYQSSKEWLATASRRVLNSYGPGISTYYAQIPELYADFAALGNGAFLSEFSRKDRRFFDLCYSPFDVYFDVDDRRQVDTVYRPMWFTKRQMELKGWLKDNVPTQIAGAKEGQRFMVVHVVAVNDNYSNGSFGKNGFPYSDIYFLPDFKHMLQEGGRYNTYQTPRGSGTQTYGFGLGDRALPDVKTANAMDRSLLEHAEWQAHPAILMPDRNELSRTRPLPRKPLYGGMSMSGRRMVDFLSPTGNIAVTHEMQRARDEQIREGFYFSLMQMSQRSGVTAVEYMAEDEKRMRMLGPHLGKIQQEFLSPNVYDRFLMLHREGQLPPPPPELHGMELKIKYVSPMANAQKSAQAAGTLRLIDSVIALKQVDETAGDNLNVDGAIRYLQDGFTAPPGILNAPEVVAQRRAAREEQAMMQQQMQMGQQGADIASKLAQVAHPRNMGQAA